MKKVLLALLLASVFPVLTPGHDAYKLEKKDSIVQVFTFSSPQKARTVKIDNVFGSITVSGTKSDGVRLEARKVLRADSQADLLKAEREVKLNMAEKDNQLDIYVDGPFRCRNGSVDWSDHDYTATYDFTVQVPEQTSLILKTVNDGDILVQHVKGDFSVRNVNGHIELQDIAGAVSVQNGQRPHPRRLPRGSAGGLLVHHGQRRPGSQLQPQTGRRLPIEDPQRRDLYRLREYHLSARKNSGGKLPAQGPLHLPQQPPPGRAHRRRRTGDSHGNDQRRHHDRQ